MTMTLDQIVNATPPMRAVEVSEWGGTVRVREMTAGQVERFLAFAKDADNEPRIAAMLAALCLCDERGVRLCGDEQQDVDRLMGTVPSGLRKVFYAAAELNGFDAKANERAEKNSESIPAPSLTTTSPERSDAPSPN